LRNIEGRQHVRFTEILICSCGETEGYFHAAVALYLDLVCGLVVELFFLLALAADQQNEDYQPLHDEVIYIMNSEEQSIGMMEGAFFVPKTDLINWVNATLNLQIVKIEQLGTGAVYCNIIDAMYPGKVALQRVNWRAKNEWEFINNYKILQQAFAKCKIQKYIDI
jgi:hypothetical protein